MRIVFLGTPETAVASLLALLDAGHEIPWVVTQPDRPAGRSRSPRPSAVKLAALARGIDVLQPPRARGDAFRAALTERHPDLLVVVAYGRILPPSVLNVAPAGAINVHFSLLPRYRGAAPVQWALAAGETVTGVTTMQMNDKLDEGPTLLQRAVPIANGEHAPALQARLGDLGAKLLIETVARLAEGTLEATPQNPDHATFAPALSREDGEVDLRLPARSIEGRVRGFDPWPGVWLRRLDRRLRLAEARELPGPPASEPPGTVVGLSSRRLALICGGGTRLELLAIQPEARRVLQIGEAISGRQLKAGDRLVRMGPSLPSDG